MEMMCHSKDDSCQEPDAVTVIFILLSFSKRRRDRNRNRQDKGAAARKIGYMLAWVRTGINEVRHSSRVPVYGAVLVDAPRHRKRAQVGTVHPPCVEPQARVTPCRAPKDPLISLPAVGPWSHA